MVTFQHNLFNYFLLFPQREKYISDKGMVNNDSIFTFERELFVDPNSSEHLHNYTLPVCGYPPDWEMMQVRYLSF